MTDDTIQIIDTSTPYSRVTFTYDDQDGINGGDDVTKLTFSNEDLDIPYFDLGVVDWFESILLPEDSFFAPVLNPIIDILIDITEFIGDGFELAAQFIADNIELIGDYFERYSAYIINEWEELRENISLHTMFRKFIGVLGDIEVNEK